MDWYAVYFFTVRGNNPGIEILRIDIEAESKATAKEISKEIWHSDSVFNDLSPIRVLAHKIAEGEPHEHSRFTDVSEEVYG